MLIGTALYSVWGPLIHIIALDPLTNDLSEVSGQIILLVTDENTEVQRG